MQFYRSVINELALVLHKLPAEVKQMELNEIYYIYLLYIINEQNREAKEFKQLQLLSLLNFYHTAKEGKSYNMDDYGIRNIWRWLKM